MSAGRGGRAAVELPQHDLAIAYPLPIADTVYWQFFRTCGFGQNLVVSHFGVPSFDPAELEQSVPDMIAAIERAASRGADMYRITGVPVLSALGRARALEVAQEASESIGAPVGLDFEDSITALRTLGARRVAFAAKWEPSLIRHALGYLADAGVDASGASSMDFRPDTLWQISTQDGLDLALGLGRDALRREPDADALFLAGGSWLSVAAVPLLEDELGVPVVTNLNATYWSFLRAHGAHAASPGLGRLFDTLDDSHTTTGAY